MRNTFIKTLTDISHSDDSVYIISGDAGFGVFEDYKSLKPDRFINAGIAEANMIGYSAGLAMTGFNVFVYNIIPFVLYRCYEQVRNDICYQKVPVTLIGIGSGLTYAPAGMTHYGVEDLTICQTLPNLVVISPSDPVETEAAVRYAAKSENPVYIRVAKSGEQVVRVSGCSDILSPAVISDGGEVAILTYGSIINEAVTAVETLKNKGISPRLISVPTIQPFPGEKIMSLLNGCKTVIILEEHMRFGGLTSRLTDYLTERQINDFKIIPLTLPQQFIHSVNNQSGMRKKFGIDSESIINAVIKS